MDNLNDEDKEFLSVGWPTDDTLSEDRMCDLSTTLLEKRNGPQTSEETTSCDEHSSLIESLTSTHGPLHLLVLCMTYAFAVGATIGVVPAVMTDQYARIYHGYQESQSCASYPSYQLKPSACIQGSDDAQTANTMASFTSNILTFLTSSIVGSLSDEFGRRSESRYEL
jgi:MFS family permease